MIFIFPHELQVILSGLTIFIQENVIVLQTIEKNKAPPPRSFQPFQIGPDNTFFAVDFSKIYNRLYCRLPLHYSMIN